MLLEQFLQQLQRSRIARVRLRGLDETLGGVREPALPAQRDAQVLETVRALTINRDGRAAEWLAFVEPAQRVQRETEIVVDEIPRRRVHRFERERLPIITHRRLVIADLL